VLDLAGLDGEPFCYVTTTGRVTGREYTIEIWFALHDGTLYLLSGGGDRSDWVRNLRRNADVQVRLGDVRLRGRARVVTDPGEDELARRIVYEKYQQSYGGDLTSWRRSALPVAVDLASP
jgi:deazaflavin-dependent oxidoreductase (nitroreductase family)